MSETTHPTPFTTALEIEPGPTFRSIFAPSGGSVATIKVPDYQRAFSWEEKQIGLFLSDLREYQTTGRADYYFGHFIVENRGGFWEIVDGQQRITTFVLFLLVCKHHHPTALPDSAESLLSRFFTVSYDTDAFMGIAARLGGYLGRNESFDPKRPPDSETLRAEFALPDQMTRSQQRIVLALLQMDRAFKRGEIDPGRISSYINVVMESHCSHHLTRNKSVAVNVFEMHNTRGVPLTTLEVVKAMLMKFVYDHGDSEAERDEQVRKIQDEFGRIYGMEESLAGGSFRGEMTTEQLLRYHLRVVDDGSKTEARQFHSPPADANQEDLAAHVGKRLRFMDDDKTPRDSKDGVAYALKLAKELRTSMQIVSEHLPKWDQEERLVGDVLILEPALSCEFFLIVCRRLEKFPGSADGRLGTDILKLWERFLFVRDFHDAYYRLWYKDDFPKLFSEFGKDMTQISGKLRSYLNDGFREQTKGLQRLVDNYLGNNRINILNNAFHWWKGKMTYAIYKYEVRQDDKLRRVMKGKMISVEHILPQEWQWDWIDGVSQGSEPSAEDKERHIKEINAYINGLGNLLLLTPGENTAAGNQHPANKRYPYQGGSYADHNGDPERWRSSNNWSQLIQERGERIFKFMRQELVAAQEGAEDTQMQ